MTAPAERIAQAKLDIHSKSRTERKRARATLLELAPPRYNVGDTFTDFMLDEVEVLEVWPITDGARGWPYVVRRTRDEWPYRTFVAGEWSEEHDH